MKKSILTVVSCIIVATLSFTGCEKYDETFNAKCVISKIWLRSEVGEPDLVFEYNDKGFVSSIHSSDSTYFEFQYNDKGKVLSSIKALNKYDIVEEIALTYTGDFITKMEYTMNGSIRMSITYTRRPNNTISAYTTEYDRDFFNDLESISKSVFFQTFIGGNIEKIEDMAKIGSKDLILKSVTLVHYDEEFHNVTKTVTTVPLYHYSIVSEYSYDESLNPFYKMPFAYADILALSKNNKITEKVLTTYYEGSTSSSVNHTYSYQLNSLDFPTRIITKSSSSNHIPVNTYILYLK